VILLTLGLPAIYRWTIFDIATTAVAQDIGVSESLAHGA
jgi:hypothetical protein